MFFFNDYVGLPLLLTQQVNTALNADGFKAPHELLLCRIVHNTLPLANHAHEKFTSKYIL